MSTINLEANEIKKIKIEIDALNNLLQNDYFLELEEELATIKNNIQSDELHAITNGINNHFITLKNNINTETNKLSDFLEKQLKDYETTEEKLKEELTTVLNKMKNIIEKINTGDNKNTEETSFWDYVKTFGLSVASSFLDLGEGVVDSHIYGTGKILQLFGLDDKWAEDAISYEVIDYDQWVSNVSDDVAYGWAHSVGNFAGEIGGYTALTSVPYVGTALCAIGKAGVETENSINEQKASGENVNDMKVFGDSLAGSAQGYASGTMANIFKKPISNLTSATAGEKTFTTAVKTAYNSGLSGAKQVIKETPKHIAKDSRTWITAGAEDTKQVLSKIGGYETETNYSGIIGTAVQNMGAAGIDVITNAIK